MRRVKFKIDNPLTAARLRASFPCRSGFKGALAMDASTNYTLAIRHNCQYKANIVNVTVHGILDHAI